MKLASGVIAFLLLPLPAQAACRHFSKWLYPYAQPRCGLAARTTNPNDRSWYVEIVKLPGGVERAIAIDHLKDVLPPR